MTYDRETSLGYMTNWAARLFVRAIERRLEGGNAGPMPVFLALQDGRAMTQTALAREASVEQPTMANTLARMERDRLVERTPDPNDRRSALVSLTELGRARAEQAIAAAMQVNDSVAGALTPEELRTYFDILGRIVATLERDTD
jgi:MarR family transcriptional regulator, transcriptional regulator for hemolysin